MPETSITQKTPISLGLLIAVFGSILAVAGGGFTFIRNDVIRMVELVRDGQETQGRQLQGVQTQMMDVRERLAAMQAEQRMERETHRTEVEALRSDFNALKAEVQRLKER